MPDWRFFAFLFCWHFSYRTCAFCKARSDWLQLPLAALHINRHRVTSKIRLTMPRVKMTRRADRNPWLAKMHISMAIDLSNLLSNTITFPLIVLANTVYFLFFHCSLCKTLDPKGPNPNALMGNSSFTGMYMFVHVCLILYQNDVSIPKLPVSMDCPFFISPTLFSNLYILTFPLLIPKEIFFS